MNPVWSRNDFLVFRHQPKVNVSLGKSIRGTYLLSIDGETLKYQYEVILASFCDDKIVISITPQLMEKNSHGADIR